eukprot:Phypoly_transcript_16203.p1 GENE.Phypoly_transcript_16203~~Phypoly_transcript_16203.p1  ORF type:complete len:285 (+),score=75.31 Phypoly_transcript_16203:80-856(+)
MEDLLVLDSAIRNWVLVPIVAVMFIVAILRSNITRLMQEDKKSDLKAIQQSQTLLRTKRLIVNGHKLPPHAFEARRQLFTDKDRGILAIKGDPAAQPAANPMSMMSDPTQMMGMMKNNMAMIVPQMLLMGWVSYFFSGFVAVKLPFPLTVRFKALLQRGIELASLDVSYVSALSWYFLVLFGLRGVIALALGEGQVVDDTKLMQQQMDATAMMQQMDITKVYISERENLELVQHNWSAEDAEIRLVGGKKKEKSKKDL